jgi:rRNA maturation protein Rpf1
VRVNRGKMSLDGVAERAIELEADRVILVSRWQRGVGKFSFFTVGSNGLVYFFPLMYLSAVCLRREFEDRGRSSSSVITVEPENSIDLEKISGCMSQFFGLPVMSIDQACERHRASMNLTFGSSRRIQITFMILRRMVEIGPRVTISKLGWEVPS